MVEDFNEPGPSNVTPQTSRRSVQQTANLANRKRNANHTLSESSSDSDGDSAEESNQPEPSHRIPQSGRKRLQRKLLWQRTVNKMKRTEGKTYINTAGSAVAEKTQGERCNCAKRCFEKIGDGCETIFTEFYKLPSKNLQDSYLYGLMKKKVIERRRPRMDNRQPKASTFVYWVSKNIFFYQKTLNFLCYRYVTMVRIMLCVKRLF